MAAEKIDALHCADFVAISLDTLDEKKGDYLKGVSGASRKGMHAIEKLKEEGIHVGSLTYDLADKPSRDR